jgi:hypothetical protein
MIQKFTKWIIYICTSTFFLSRLFVMYELFLFHKQDIRDDEHFNTLCLVNELPEKYTTYCRQARDGVHTPILIRIIRDTIDQTVQEIMSFGNLTYSWILGIGCSIVIIMWIFSSIFGKIQQSHQSFFIPLTQPIHSYNPPMYNNKNLRYRHKSLSPIEEVN